MSSNYDRNNKINNALYENDRIVRNQTLDNINLSPEPAKLARAMVTDQPPPVPQRAKVSIKQQSYTERDQHQAPTPEPRRRLNVSELRSQFNGENDQHQVETSEVKHQFRDQPTSLTSTQAPPPPLPITRRLYDHQYELGNKRERVHEIQITDHDDDDDDDYDEVIDYEPDECYQDEDDDYDDSGLQSHEHVANEDLVDLSRQSMVPLDELIAYYQYIQQGSSSISDIHEQEESSSAAVSRQSSNASQQTAKYAQTNAMRKLEVDNEHHQSIKQQKSIDNQSVEFRQKIEQKQADDLQSVIDKESIFRHQTVPEIHVERVVTTGTTSTPSTAITSSEIDVDEDSQKVAKSKQLVRRRVRANVVLELINSERDFVKHLKDVVEGYLYPARRHPEIFTGERINTIFANIEQLYEFQRKFLECLELCINWQDLAASEVGKCFLDHEKGFSVYHYYCNNHPNATSELQDLYTKPRFVKFFEACRVLQNMIDISLDGFLLTPIQKICKYPLQLTELLKNTDESHADYVHVVNALETMRNCANLANERKRRIESLADIMSFQERVENWFGPKLSDTSSILIHSAEVMKMNTSNSWSQGVQLYLFDHLLLYLKKDILLKRSNLVLKGRICMDTVTEISDADEYKPKRSFKLYCGEQEKWFVFITRSEKEKDEWIQAFERERNLVEADENEGFHITEREIGIARRALQHRKHSRSARYRHKHRPDTAIVDQIDLDDANMIMNRTLSLPSCIHPSHVMNFVEDSKVISKSTKSAAQQQQQHSPGSRSPGSSLHHHHNQQNVSLLQQNTLASAAAASAAAAIIGANDQHSEHKSQVATGVNWFKKMGSKKLAKSQVYTITHDSSGGSAGGGQLRSNQSSGALPLKLGSTIPASSISSSSMNQPAQLTGAQIITSDKAAIKYEELEKRHREHMSSEEQARLYWLNNELPPPPSMFLHHHHHHQQQQQSQQQSSRSTPSAGAAATKTSHSGRWSSSSLAQQQQQQRRNSSQSTRKSLTTTTSPTSNAGRSPTQLSFNQSRAATVQELAQQLQPVKLNDNVEDNNEQVQQQQHRRSVSPSSFETTLVLSSGRVVKVREDAV